MKTTCAICGSRDSDGHSVWDGRRVRSCAPCRSDEPYGIVDVHRGYQLPEDRDLNGRLVSFVAVAAQTPAPRKRTRRAGMGPSVGLPEDKRIPGARLHRVLRWVKRGKPLLTFEAAQAIAETKPWYDRSLFLGGDARAWVWQEVQ